ncbi:MAG: NYN domain-containing protein [Chloroflexi bacterium]|nr:NYN domain-containing protein [Chloroflexota bacterium]
MHYPEKPTRRTALYVDVENLGGNARALRFVESLLDDWALDLPQPHFLYFYTRADQRVMWEMWGIDRFPEKCLTVKGVQHFSNQSKNSADITLAMDAVLDFQTDRAQNIVIVSDDSDFTSLFDKIRDLHTARKKDASDIPFKWVMTDRANTKASVLTEFFPSSFIYINGMSPIDEEVKSIASEVTEAAGEPSHRDLARIISEHFGPGESFKSTDCQKIISGVSYNHHSTKMKGPAFGTWFSKNVTPELKKLGVKEVGKSPRRFQVPTSR